MSWAWLWRGERSKAVALPHVLFYTRHGCHLCDEAWEIVTAAQKKHGFTLIPIDIDTDPALAKAHGECVPVVAINGKIRFRGRVSTVLLERIVRKA